MTQLPATVLYDAPPVLSPELITISTRIITFPKWVWTPGMCALSPAGYPIWIQSPKTPAEFRPTPRLPTDGYGYIPDITDFATAGAMLALLDASARQCRPHRDLHLHSCGSLWLFEIIVDAPGCTEHMRDSTGRTPGEAIARMVMAYETWDISQMLEEK